MPIELQLLVWSALLAIIQMLVAVAGAQAQVSLPVLAGNRDNMPPLTGWALRATRAHLNMLESLTDGFCAVDRDWRITYINGRALEMAAPLNKSRRGLRGRNLWDEF